MQWPRSLKTLWRKAFPVRLVLVYRDRRDGIPSAFDDDGEMTRFDTMLPELVEAYTTCAPMFKWLAMEMARKEKLYHALPPVTDAAAYAAWHRTMENLNAQIAALNVAIRVPQIANKRIIQIQELAEQRKASDAERAAIEDLISE